MKMDLFLLIIYKRIVVYSTDVCCFSSIGFNCGFIYTVGAATAVAVSKLTAGGDDLGFCDVRHAGRLSARERRPMAKTPG